MVSYIHAPRFSLFIFYFYGERIRGMSKRAKESADRAQAAQAKMAQAQAETSTEQTLEQTTKDK